MKTRFKNIAVSLLIMSSIYGCSEKRKISFTQESAQGTWMVHAFHLDKDFYKPGIGNEIMEFANDTVSFKNILEQGEEKKYGLKFLKDSLVIDTIVLPKNRFKILGNQLQFGRRIAHRMMPANQISAKFLEVLLVSNNWENEKGVFHFEENEQFRFVPKDSTEYFTYCYQLITYENKVFLIKKGNQLACDRDQQFIEQILSVSDKQLVTFGFVDGAFKEIVYNKLPEAAINIKPTVFQLCNSYINKNSPSDRYYGKGTEYNGGLYHIRKIFNQEYKPPVASKESGIFQVLFVVNCEGKAGMFAKQAFDYDYNLKEFPVEIGDQIFEITKSLQDWNPGRRPGTNKVIDTYIYLSFRIKNGKIVRIYP